LAIVGAVLFLLAFIAALFQLVDTFRKRQNPLLPQIIEKRYGRVSYQALANGTNGFSQANLLGKGSFGAVYQCNFQDEGTVVAVKVFNIEQSGSTRSFVAECEALRRVRHRCLVKIVTCCSSINHQGQEFKALVFEFMPNGSLNNWLHPESNIPTLSNTLSLAQRLDIAVDITDALDYLHNHCQPPVVHCDIKPNNILLAEDLSARVGDFGISRFVPESASEALKISNSTTGIRGTVGYVAPGN
jgi:serine/threonine protein kinase